MRASLWSDYLLLMIVENAFTNLKGGLAIGPIDERNSQATRRLFILVMPVRGD
jgi:hypothetical protein